ncbi:MAG TPA: hypothetical protein DCZ55_19630 [Cyanobacteria bacterium UBA11371]|nr:hypothetical protein [Cyanobacteria bacterium UBA11371]
MSLDVRNSQVALKPSSEDIKSQPWSMEAAAERLMDDVFAEVDTMLKTGGELRSEPAPQEYVTMQQIAVPRINMPPTMQERPLEAAPPTAEKAEKQEKSGNSFEKLLLVAACTSLGITLLLWLASSGRLNGLLGANAPSTSVAEKTVSPADSQFMDYMQRSLDKFNQQSAAPQPEAAPQAAPQVANAQIPVPFPGTLPNLSERPQSVLERVYIPVTPRVQTVYVNPTVVQPSPSPQAGSAPRTRPAAAGANAAGARVSAPVAAAGATLAPRNRVSASAPSPLATPAPKPRPAAPAPMSRPEIKTSRPAVPIQAARPTALGVKLGPPLPQQMATSRSPIPDPVPRSAVASRPAPAPSPRPSIAAWRPAPASSPSPRATVAARPAPAPSPSPQATVAARPAPAPSPSPRQRVATRAALPAATSTNAGTASSVQTTPRAESTQAAAPQSSIRHVLRGVLKSEDSSKDAALFEVNGVTRRVTVGENISSSGWTLVEITNQEAVIRRNGEVRSIYAGQDF